MKLPKDYVRVTFDVTNIEWETDGESVNLPTEKTVTVEMPKDQIDFPEDFICEKLSDDHDFFVNHFKHDNMRFEDE